MGHIMGDLPTSPSHRDRVVQRQRQYAWRPLQRFSVPRQLIAQGLLVGFLSILGMPLHAQPLLLNTRGERGRSLSRVSFIHNESMSTRETLLTVAQTQDAAKTSAVTQQLQGQWQTKDPKSGKAIALIFAPDGNLFMVLPAPNGSSAALKLGYKINSTTQPMHLDMILSPEQTVTTIFELTPQGKLRLQLDGISAGDPRPTTFSATSSLFEKVSDNTSVPKDAGMIAIETQKNNSQSVVKQYITILNQAQQAYFLKNGKFASNVEELGIITNLETEQYRYQIVPQKDNAQSVMMAAIPKKAELPSYTSAVFATQVNGKAAIAAQICETEKPSTSPPAMPAPPKTGSLEVQCPAGSRPLR